MIKNDFQSNTLLLEEDFLENIEDRFDKLIIGFTGSREGMTPEQFDSTHKTIQAYQIITPKIVAHHGVCIGADLHFHKICEILSIYTIGHPGIRPDGKCFTRASCQCNELRLPKPFAARDRDIVDVSDILMATPSGWKEEIRSGTWATIRYARKVHHRIVIVWPDGTLKEENFSQPQPVEEPCNTKD
jgi:hypothetical protein